MAKHTTVKQDYQILNLNIKTIVKTLLIEVGYKIKFIKYNNP